MALNFATFPSNEAEGYVASLGKTLVLPQVSVFLCVKLHKAETSGTEPSSHLDSFLLYSSAVSSFGHSAFVLFAIWSLCAVVLSACHLRRRKGRIMTTVNLVGCSPRCEVLTTTVRSIACSSSFSPAAVAMPGVGMFFRFKGWDCFFSPTLYHLKMLNSRFSYTAKMLISENARSKS